MSSVNNSTISSFKSEIKATRPTNYLPWMALIIGIFCSVGAGVGVGCGVSLTAGGIAAGGVGFVSLAVAIYLWNIRKTAKFKQTHIPNAPSNPTSVVRVATESSSKVGSSTCEADPAVGKNIPIIIQPSVVVASISTRSTITSNSSNISNGKSQLGLTQALIKYENKNTRKAISQVRSIHSWIHSGDLNLEIVRSGIKGYSPTYIAFQFKYSAFSDGEIDPTDAFSCMETIGKIYCDIRKKTPSDPINIDYNVRGLIIGRDWDLPDFLEMMGFRRKSSNSNQLELSLTFSSHTVFSSSASTRKDPAQSAS